MPNVSRDIFIGRVCRTPEVGTLDTGEKFVRLGVVYDYRLGGKDVPVFADAYLINTSVRRLADAAEFLVKNDPVYLESRLLPEKFFNPTGTNRLVLMVTTLEYMGRKSDRDRPLSDND